MSMHRWIGIGMGKSLICNMICIIIVLGQGADVISLLKSHPSICLYVVIKYHNRLCPDFPGFRKR